MNIEVRNKKTFKGEGFLIDRTTPFGNPFKISDNLDRTHSIERYGYFVKKALMKNDTEFTSMFCFLESQMYEAVQRSKPLVLICHCSPLPCHGDVIKQILLNKFHEKYWFVREVCPTCGHGEYKIGVYGL